MPKRKPMSEEEEEEEEEDELANDNSDYAEESGNGEHLVTTAAHRGPTRKKAKPTKAEDKPDVDESLARKSKTGGAKTTDPSKNTSDIMVKSTSDGEKYIELGKKKRVTVRIFKGTPLIDIREFYTDAGGADKPGKKGLSLGLDQWETLKTSSKVIDELLVNLKNKKDNTK